MSDYIEQSAAQHGGVIERQQLAAFKGITRDQRMELRAWVQNDAIPVLGKLADAARHITRHDRQSRAADGSPDRSLLSSGSAVAGSNKALFAEAAEAVLPLLSEEEAMGVRDALAKVQAPAGNPWSTDPSAAGGSQASENTRLQRELDEMVDLRGVGSDMRGTPVGDGTTGDAYKSKRDIHGGSIPAVSKNPGDIIASGGYGNVFLNTDEAEDLLKDGSNRAADDNGRYLRIWDQDEMRAFTADEMNEYYNALDNGADMSQWHDRGEDSNGRARAQLRVVLQASIGGNVDTPGEIIDMFTDNDAGSTAVIDEVTRDLYGKAQDDLLNTPAKFAEEYAGASGAGNTQQSERNYAVLIWEKLSGEERAGGAAARAAGTYTAADYTAAQNYAITEKDSKTILTMMLTILGHEGGGQELSEADMIRVVEASRMGTYTNGRKTRALTHGITDWEEFKRTDENGESDLTRLLADRSAN